MATFATLLDRPQSDLAKGLCNALLECLLRDRQKPKPRQKQKEAFGGLIADLLHRDPADNGGWLYRAIRPEGFTGEAIGYRVVRPIFEAMTADRFIEVELGKQRMAKGELTGGNWQIAGQQATRFRATDALRQWFEDRGIALADWHEHFGPDADALAKAQSKPQAYLILRGGKPPRSTGIGKRPSLPIDPKDPMTAAMIARMEKLNGFLSNQAIEPFGPTVHLKRIFAEGQLPDHGWRHGGRLYALSRGNYQNAKREARKAITLNGLSTVELDLRSSHLTILAGLGHVPKECLEGDPYTIDGIPRAIVKQWVTMTISHGKRHRSWPKEAAADLTAKYGIDPIKEYPIKETGDRILEKLPLPLGGGTNASVGWGELQFLESEIILSVMETLAYEHDIPALPVHDSLIVPTASAGLVKRIIGEIFKDRLGVSPVIEG
ncbi:hypothetical protein [Sphingomonas sp. IC081]|uniref:hypothetical protein n=1 Tax=Sphingomonas sp. IC081 TaxID=304378 RepID=UPI001158CA75|nr:hypothetical protein [Sphingomonas sp. IC081]